MPIYEYRCGACGHTLDALQKVSDPHLTECPECDSPALKRLISAPAFRLKGSGWYETDFKSEKEKKRNLVDSKSDSDSKAPADASKDSKTKAEGAKSSGDGAASSGKKKEPATKPAGGSEAA